MIGLLFLAATAVPHAAVTRNEKDIGGIVPGSQNLLYQDVASNTEVLRVLDDSTSATGKRLPCRRNEPKRLMSHGCIGFVAMNFNKSTIATCKARPTGQEVTWS